MITTTGLEHRAMLITLKVTCWTGRKTDNTLSAELTESKGAKRGTARVTKDIIPREPIKGVRALYDAAMDEVQRVSLPWDDSGRRLVPAEKMVALRIKLGELRDVFWQKVYAMAEQYAELRATASSELGDLFRESDYPPAFEIPHRHRFDWHFEPVPTTGDIRVDVDDDLRDELAREMEAAVQQRLVAATEDVLRRVQKAVDRIQRILSAENPRIFDTLATDMVDLIEVLPALNVANDPAVNKLTEALRSRFTGLSADTLRRDEAERATVAKAASDVLGMMEGML